MSSRENSESKIVEDCKILRIDGYHWMVYVAADQVASIVGLAGPLRPNEAEERGYRLARFNAFPENMSFPSKKIDRNIKTVNGPN